MVKNLFLDKIYRVFCLLFRAARSKKKSMRFLSGKPRKKPAAVILNSRILFDNFVHFPINLTKCGHHACAGFGRCDLSVQFHVCPNWSKEHECVAGISA